MKLSETLPMRIIASTLLMLAVVASAFFSEQSHYRDACVESVIAGFAAMLFAGGVVLFALRRMPAPLESQAGDVAQERNHAA